MNVVLYGATGRAGSRILEELVSRGHHVIAIARDPERVKQRDNVSIQADDVSDVHKSAQIMKSADAVISAYAPPQQNVDELEAFTIRLAQAVKESGVPRLLMVGGAGGLEVAPGVTLIDSGYLPPEWLPIAKAHGKALAALRSTDIDWTYLAPSSYFDPGERTGHFRLGTDKLLMDEKGDSKISMEDYAIAMVDELESPKYIRQRFTVGY